ncbi:DUF1348-domain-containing protein [Fomitiporia mediterranea MF3/22]|uniref:DUF1348-domain-containing protein n=1 Tax=Fomitiporia mediterranea (strain MF3/22) TaxID=694068 RepID=UPI00044091FD|nr:DUF1348-domain-containing protein [Fomitiporia mediterranea MF3/22]EJD05400.1 DUF1348-domain-containing protein [Fomitiporia mediterranea MF3/22]
MENSGHCVFVPTLYKKKVKLAQKLWNTKDPAKVALAYTEDTIWRNRDQFPCGRAEIIDFLTKKWQKEKRYKLRKELFAWTDNKIAVQFWYEFYDEAEKSWYRCYGLEDWTYNEDGLMRKRQMSGNNVKIAEHERFFHENMTDEDVDKVSISEKHW